MWPALNCVRLHVFLWMRKDRLSPGLNGQGVTSTHTQWRRRAQTFWRMVIRSAPTLFLIRSAALGLFRSPTALPESSSPTSGLLCQCHSSALIFSLLCLPPIINQCQAIQQQGRHSFPPACLFSSSDMSLCSDPPPPPTMHPPSSFSHGPRARTQGPRCQHERLFRGSARKREKWGGGISLSLNLSPSRYKGEKKRDSTVIYIIHGTNGRKQTIEWFKKRESLDETVTGGRREMYASLCALGPIFPAPSHSSPLPTHTQSHCPLFVINLCLPYASLPI